MTLARNESHSDPKRRPAEDADRVERARHKERDESAAKYRENVDRLNRSHDGEIDRALKEHAGVSRRDR
jgi:hypothetical protein